MIIIMKKEEEMVVDTNGRKMEKGVEDNGGWMVVKEGYKKGKKCCGLLFVIVLVMAFVIIMIIVSILIMIIVLIMITNIISITIMAIKAIIIMNIIMELTMIINTDYRNEYGGECHNGYWR